MKTNVFIYESYKNKKIMHILFFEKSYLRNLPEGARDFKFSGCKILYVLLIIIQNFSVKLGSWFYENGIEICISYVENLLNLKRVEK